MMETLEASFYLLGLSAQPGCQPFVCCFKRVMQLLEDEKGTEFK